MITQHINRSNGVLKIPYRLSNTKSKEVRVVGTNETDFNPNVVLLLRFNAESCSWLEEKKGQTDGRGYKTAIHRLDYIKMAIKKDKHETFTLSAEGRTGGQTFP